MIFRPATPASLRPLTSFLFYRFIGETRGTNFLIVQIFVQTYTIKDFKIRIEYTIEKEIIFGSITSLYMNFVINTLCITNNITNSSILCDQAIIHIYQ